jgi:5'-deoxynucleotidase YfbR-like HD superfamily hydrolase
VLLSPSLLPLLRELGDLKRIRSAERSGSIAERLFARAWAALAAGDDPEGVMVRTVAAALAAARLGDLDRAKLAELGLSDAEAATVLERGSDGIAAQLEPALGATLRAALADGAPPEGPCPRFVGQLAGQPRAGVTCPGRPRLLLQPPENHAEHCLIVAVYGVILAPDHAANPTDVFVASMAHHFHNAAMPDAGFTGEVLLGDLLDRVIADAREVAMAELSPLVATGVRAALAPIGGDATAEARTFHAADVLDRVLEIEQHLRAASATMDTVLHDYELVHAGPVKTFHDEVLRQVGLL